MIASLSPRHCARIMAVHRARALGQQIVLQKRSGRWMSAAEIDRWVTIVKKAEVVVQ